MWIVICSILAYITGLITRDVADKLRSNQVANSTIPTWSDVKDIAINDNNCKVSATTEVLITLKDGRQYSGRFMNWRRWPLGTPVVNWDFEDALHEIHNRWVWSEEQRRITEEI